MRRPAVALAGVLLGAAFLLLVVARLPEPLGVDQGLFACFTRWVPRGWLPYRDLFDSKPPLFLYWWGLARVVPGELPRAVWWFEAIWLSATLAVCYALGARLFGRVAGLSSAALLLVGLWSPQFGGFWSRAQAEEVLALPMLTSAWLSLRAAERPRLAYLAGVAVGVCGLFKIPSMAIGGAWAVGLLALHPAPLAVRRIGVMFAGAASAWVVAALWFLAHGALPAFVEGVFVYHRYNAELISPPWSFVLEGFARRAFAGALLPIVAAASAMFLLLRRRPRARQSAWLLAWIVLTMAAIVLQRQLAGYHFLLMAPALSIAGGYGVAVALRAARSRGVVRVVGVVASIGLGVLALDAAEQLVRAYGPGLRVMRGQLDRVAYLRSIQQGNYSNVTEEEAARVLAARTAPSTGILVWGLSPGIYAFADRHPTTRYPFHKLLYTDAPLSRMIPGLETRRAELIERLERDPPGFVLVGQGDANGFEPLDSMTTMLRFPRLRELLARDYEREPSIGRFVVYRRR